MKRRFPDEYKLLLEDQRTGDICNLNYKKIFYKNIDKWVREKGGRKGVGCGDIIRNIKRIPWTCTQPIEQLVKISRQGKVYDDSKIINCNFELFKKWIRGYNVNYYVPQFSHGFPPSKTALHAFCSNGFINMDKCWKKIKYLVENLNADVNYKELSIYQTSPLLAACERGNEKLCSYLLMKGANILDVDNRGKGLFEISTIELATIISDFSIENKLIELPEYYYNKPIKGINESCHSWIRFIPNEQIRNVFISLLELNNDVKPEKEKHFILICPSLKEPNKNVTITSRYHYAANVTKGDVWKLIFDNKKEFCYEYVDANYHTWNKKISFSGEKHLFKFLKKIGLNVNDTVPFLIFMFSYTNMYQKWMKREHLMKSAQFTCKKLPSLPSWFEKTRDSWMNIKILRNIEVDNPQIITKFDDIKKKCKIQ